mgnify:CR=1 FL=1
MTEEFAEDKRNFTEKLLEVLDFILYLFPDELEKIDKIYIISSRLGTAGSFYSVHKKSRKKDFYIFFRIDIGYKGPLRSIVSRIVYDKCESIDSPERWMQAQSIIDFIHSNTVLKQIIGSNKISIG